MDILKTPHQKLLEEAGATPASPGMVHTPKQMLMQESGIMPRFADGGNVSGLPNLSFDVRSIPNMAGTPGIGYEQGVQGATARMQLEKELKNRARLRAGISGMGMAVPGQQGVKMMPGEMDVGAKFPIGPGNLDISARRSINPIPGRGYNQGINAQYSMPFADGGSVQMSPEDMMAELIYSGRLPEYFAKGGTVNSAEFEAALESAKRQPGFLKRGASKTLGATNKLFNRLNPAFQVMAAEDAGSRALDAAERAYHGDYRGAAISGLGAIGSGVGMAPGVVPQLVSIPLSFGADYLQEYFDEKDPHKSRASLKIQN